MVRHLSFLKIAAPSSAMLEALTNPWQLFAGEHVDHACAADTRFHHHEARPRRLLRGRCAFQSSSPKFHRPKRGDGKQVAGDVSDFDASESGGRKSRFQQIAHLL